ncbi:MAG: hypothetical protein R3A52_10995 [Polyangiales bacterium]
MKRSHPLALAAVLLAGCGSLFGTDDPDAGPSPNGVGSRCETTDQCRAGLRCASGACALSGATAEGEGCVLTGECAAGLYCSPLGRCAAAGSAVEGASCGDTAGCSPGLVCVRPEGELFGYCRAPRGASAGDGGVATDAGAGAGAGPSDLNGPCADALGCLAGLACDLGARRCVPPAQVGATTTPWPGETCDDGPTGQPVRAYFEVPAADGSPPHDFFRLPFPNDIRRDASTGRVNLAGFPHPGTALLGFDLVDRYLRAAERDLDGFGTNSIIYFRFSGRLDFATLRLNDTIHLVDLTTGTPTNTIRFGASTAGNRYLCANPVYVDTGHGAPMEPGHTYAAWLTTGVRAEGGGSVSRDDDFGLMLAATAPADPVKARAWAAYAPLRQHLATSNVDPSTLLTAAVFTTQRPWRAVEALRAAVQAAPPPTASGFVRCDAGVRSPCDDGLAGDAHVRGCVGAADPRFDELQGLIELPVFQSGARPYRDAGSGAIALDAQGRATATGTERVCVTVTVPRGAAMPASGWPVAVYFHGTGGSYRSVVTEGLAGALASVDLGGGAAPVNVATVGVEGVMHGTRRGDGVTDPSDRLFFNFANPQAARDNVLQGAADLFAVVRALGAVNLSELPRAGQSVRFDAARVAFIGHSQGSTVGLPALAYEPGSPPRCSRARAETCASRSPPSASPSTSPARCPRCCKTPTRRARGTRC